MDASSRTSRAGGRGSRGDPARRTALRTIRQRHGPDAHPHTMRRTSLLLLALGLVSTGCSGGSGGDSGSGGGPTPPPTGGNPTASLESIDTDADGDGDDIVDLPASVDPFIRDLFARYTAVWSPNGGRIHLLAEAGVPDTKLRRARAILDQHLVNVSGTAQGANKADVADAMAAAGATLAIFQNASTADPNQRNVAPLHREFEPGRQHAPDLVAEIVEHAAKVEVAGSPVVGIGKTHELVEQRPRIVQHLGDQLETARPVVAALALAHEHMTRDELELIAELVDDQAGQVADGLDPQRVTQQLFSVAERLARVAKANARYSCSDSSAARTTRWTNTPTNPAARVAATRLMPWASTDRCFGNRRAKRQTTPMRAFAHPSSTNARPEPTAETCTSPRRPEEAARSRPGPTARAAPHDITRQRIESGEHRDSARGAGATRARTTARGKEQRHRREGGGGTRTTAGRHRRSGHLGSTASTPIPRARQPEAATRPNARTVPRLAAMGSPVPVKEGSSRVFCVGSIGAANQLKDPSCASIAEDRHQPASRIIEDAQVRPVACRGHGPIRAHRSRLPRGRRNSGSSRCVQSPKRHGPTLRRTRGIPSRRRRETDASSPNARTPGVSTNRVPSPRSRNDRLPSWYADPGHPQLEPPQTAAPQVDGSKELSKLDLPTPEWPTNTAVRARQLAAKQHRDSLRRSPPSTGTAARSPRST